jgi:flagellar motor switch/type III secretory pathway protein FliN
MSAAAHNLQEVPIEPARPANTTEAADALDGMLWLPCTLSLDVPVVRFTIHDLLTLKKGTIVETAYHQTSDLPLRVNQMLVGWTEFEVIGDRLSVRITEQA